MWIIWRERNGRCFEDQERSLEELKKLFIQTLFHWTNAFCAPQFLLCLNFFLFVPLFPFNEAYLCIFHMYLGCVPLLFSINHLFIYIKKKKKTATVT
jgi:hypothetical protein